MADPLIRTSDEIEYEAVDAADGLEKGVLIADDHGAPNFAIRRFVLESGAEVPEHTNAVEHEQYVLEGAYTSASTMRSTRSRRATRCSFLRERSTGTETRATKTVRSSVRSRTATTRSNYSSEAGDCPLVPYTVPDWGSAKRSSG